MNNNNISVTIGIPIYNVADCLEPSLLSALSQTYQNIEYILVDDCGTDNSMEIAERIISQSDRKDRVRIVHHTVNKGLGEARNTAIAHTETDYLYFMDSDDILPLDAIDNLVQLAIKYDHPDIVIGSHVQRSINGDEHSMNSADSEIFLEGIDQITEYFKNHSIIVSSWNKLFFTEFLRKNSIKYIHRIHEDYYFSLQELYFSNSIVLTQLKTYYYVLRFGSITNGLKPTEKTIDAITIVAHDIYSFLSAHQSSDFLYYKSYLLLVYTLITIALGIHSCKTKDILSTMPSRATDIKYIRWANGDVRKTIFLSSLFLPKRLRYYFIVCLFNTIEKIKIIK